MFHTLRRWLLSWRPSTPAHHITQLNHSITCESKGSSVDPSMRSGDLKYNGPARCCQPFLPHYDPFWYGHIWPRYTQMYPLPTSDRGGGTTITNGTSCRELDSCPGQRDVSELGSRRIC